MKRAFISFCLLCAGLGAAAQGVRFTNTPRRDPMREQMNKLANAVLAITSLYVDTVDNKKLVEGAINGMLSKLDPHSAYTNASETKKLTEPLAGSFEGIGVQFNMLEDTLVVIQPVPKGPSERVGIQAGDRIVSVADTAIAGVKMSKEEIMRRLRGPKGTIAHLKVVRLGIRDTLSFDVKRDKIPVNSVDAAYMVTPTIGLIRFNNFAETTPKEVLHALDTLKGQGMKDLIIDLQQNGGGYLQAAADIASEFLEKGARPGVPQQGRRGVHHRQGGRAGGRVQCLSLGDSLGCHSGSGPGHRRGAENVRQGPRATSHHDGGRQHDTPHRGAILYAQRTLHPETL